MHYVQAVLQAQFSLTAVGEHSPTPGDCSCPPCIGWLGPPTASAEAAAQWSPVGSIGTASGAAGSTVLVRPDSLHGFRGEQSQLQPCVAFTSSLALDLALQSAVQAHSASEAGAASQFSVGLVSAATTSADGSRSWPSGGVHAPLPGASGPAVAFSFGPCTASRAAQAPVAQYPLPVSSAAAHSSGLSRADQGLGAHAALPFRDCGTDASSKSGSPDGQAWPPTRDQLFPDLSSAAVDAPPDPWSTPGASSMQTATFVAAAGLSVLAAPGAFRSQSVASEVHCSMCDVGVGTVCAESAHDLGYRNACLKLQRWSRSQNGRNWRCPKCTQEYTGGVQLVHEAPPCAENHSDVMHPIGQSAGPALVPPRLPTSTSPWMSFSSTPVLPVS